MGVGPVRVASRRWRRERGLSIVSMATMLGVSASNLHRYEIGAMDKRGYGVPDDSALAEKYREFVHRWHTVPEAREQLEAQVRRDKLARSVAARVRMKARTDGKQST